MFMKGRPIVIYERQAKVRVEWEHTLLDKLWHNSYYLGLTDLSSRYI